MLLALGVDMVDQLKLVLGREWLGRFELGQQLDGIGPHEFDLLDAPAGLDQAQGAPTLFLGLPDISTRTNKPVWGPMAPDATLDQAP